MQVSNSDNLSKRIRYYQGLIDLDKLKHGQHYNSLVESFIIFIYSFDRFNAGRHIYTFCETCLECPFIGLNDSSTKIFLSTKGTTDDVSSTLKAFLDYVDCGIIAGDFVQELDADLQLVKSNQKVIKEFITYEMSLLESLMEGEQRGLLLGRQQGRNQEKESVALKRIHNDKYFDEIYELTDLPLERIKQLADNIFY